MKTKILLSVVVLVTTSLAVRSQQAGVHFEEELTWKQIFKKAKKEHKYVFVDCYATWCGPCKMMDKNVYSNDSLGNIIDKDFISVRLQCDSTRSDDKRVKSWYKDAYAIISTYHIEAYPSLLFFSSDGKLVHKGVGYQDPAGFGKLARDAADPSTQYYTLVKKYEDGKMDYADIPAFAKMVQHFPNKVLYAQIIRDYISNYTDKLPDGDFFTKLNLERISLYVSNLNSSDASFTRIMQEPKKVDVAMGEKGYSFGIVSSVIYAEMITPEIKKAIKNESTPGWEEVERAIANRYGRIYAAKNIVKAKMRWYQEKKDTVKLCAAAVERIELNFEDSATNGAYNAGTLNEYAWNLFLMSTDLKQLQKALEWSELSVKKLDLSSPFLGVYTDTKANLLYKLGRKQEALDLDEQALALAKVAKRLNPEYITEIQANVDRMKEGKPTW